MRLGIAIRLVVLIGVAISVALIGAGLSSSMVEKPKLFDRSLPWMMLNVSAILRDSYQHGVVVVNGSSDLVVLMSYVDGQEIVVSSGYKGAGSFKINRSELVEAIMHLVELVRNNSATLILLPRAGNNSIRVVATLYCGDLRQYLSGEATDLEECVDRAVVGNETAWRISTAFAEAYAYRPLGAAQRVEPPTIWVAMINVTGVKTGDPYLSYIPFTYPNPIRDQSLRDWLRFVNNLFASAKCIWTKDPWCWGTSPPQQRP